MSIHGHDHPSHEMPRVGMLAIHKGVLLVLRDLAPELPKKGLP